MIEEKKLRRKINREMSVFALKAVESNVDALAPVSDATDTESAIG